MEVHPTAIIESNDIGDNTKICANVHIQAGVVVGRNCEIKDGVAINSGARIGDGVRIGHNAYIDAGVIIEDRVCIGACVVFSSELPPGSSPTLNEILVCAGATVGSNSTVLRGIKIGHKAYVSPGSVVAQTIPQNAIVSGNPAKIVGYVNSPRLSVAEVTKLDTQSGEVYSSKVSGVSVIRLPSVPDIRGNLTFGEFHKHIPFKSERFFIIYGVPSDELRGEHAHKENHQFLICVNGSIHALVDDGRSREEFVLDSPSIGIHIPPMVWGTQYKYSEGSILLVFASHLYDPNGYIRDYQDFISQVR